MRVMFLVFSAVLADASGLSDDSPGSTTQSHCKPIPYLSQLEILLFTLVDLSGHITSNRRIKGTDH